MNQVLVRNVGKDNPIALRNPEVKELDRAFKDLIDSLPSFAAANNLSEQEVSDVKNLLEEAYLNKRARLFVESRLSKLKQRLDYNFRCAIEVHNNNVNIENSDEYFEKVIYLKNQNKHIVHNELF